MNTLVVEGVVCFAEVFLERLAIIKTGIVLPCKEPDVFDLEVADDISRLCHAFSALLGIVGCVSNVAGEYDKVWLYFQAVHRCDGFLQGACRIGVYLWATKAPVSIRHLNKNKIFL